MWSLEMLAKVSKLRKKNNFVILNLTCLAAAAASKGFSAKRLKPKPHFQRSRSTKVSPTYLFFYHLQYCFYYYYFSQALSAEQLKVNGLNSFSTQQSEACGLMKFNTFKSLFTTGGCTASFEINLLFLLLVYCNRNTFWRR